MLAAALLLTAATSTTAQIKVHSIGDSTMQTYDESSTDKRGWVQMLQQFFDANFVTVNNRGKSGASSKSFYNEAAYWPTMVASKSSNTFVRRLHSETLVESLGNIESDTKRAASFLRRR